MPLAGPTWTAPAAVLFSGALQVTVKGEASGVQPAGAFVSLTNRVTEPPSSTMMGTEVLAVPSAPVVITASGVPLQEESA